MPSVDQERATVADLYRVEGKAELIEGRIVPLMPTGRRSNRVAGNIYLGLRGYERDHGRGEAYTDNIGYVVPELPSGRESFSPDASYCFGPFTDDPMRFLRIAPEFAVEVRSEHDYGPAADREIAAKRADYFAAGTLVVWDVDAAAREIRSYRGPEAEPVAFRSGEVADAEPAVPGWRIAVDEVFA